MKSKRPATRRAAARTKAAGRKRAAVGPAAASTRVSSDRLQNIIDLSTEYYWETDAEHRITQLQGRAEDRRSRRDLLGRRRWELGGTPVTDGGSWNGHRQTLDKRLPFRDFIYTIDDPQDGRHYLSISGKPAYDSDGVFLGYRGITRDITQEMRADALMRLENLIMRRLAGAGAIVEAVTSAIQAICESQEWDAGSFWKFDETTGRIGYAGGWCTDRKPVLAEISEQARNFSFRPGEGLPGSVFQTGKPLWVPDIVKDPRVSDHRVTQLTGWNSAFLFPIQSGKEVLGVLDFYAPRIRKPDERLLQVIGVLGQEIGHFYRRALTLERLRESEERYSSTVELAAIGIVHVGRDGRFINVNRRFCEMLGYAPEELLRRTVRDISHPEDVDVTKVPAERLHKGEIPFFQCEKRYLRKDGTPIWVELTAAAKRDRDGRFLHDISVVKDISARREADARIQHLATHDNLTGLPNRAMFNQLLALAVQTARRYQRKFGVLFIDLDGFKVVNDTLGHEAGDALLMEMAFRFKNCLRSSDVVARFGGDEFVAIVQEISEDAQIAKVASNVLSAAAKAVEIKGGQCRVTASIGISLFPLDAGDEQALLKNADTAMYAAKSAGKNNFRFFRDHGTP